MISAFTPPGIRVVALRTGYGVEAGHSYTVRGFVLNRHWRTREPDPHVLLEELRLPAGLPESKRDKVGFPRDGFIIPDTHRPAKSRELEAA